MESYALDTSAILSLYRNEAGAGEVERLLRLGQKKKAAVWVSFASVTELFYVVWQKSGQDAAYQAVILLKTLPIRRIDPDESLLLLAGELKANYPISLGDSFIAAGAIQKKAALVHKDPEFDSLGARLTSIRLPYKGV